MHTTLFSIVTPSYNRIDQLRKCVGSVSGQTNILREHIVQDNNSNDGTDLFLSSIKKNRDICYNFSYQRDADFGMYDAINKGWGRSNGDILSWLNCDEQYLPNTLNLIATLFANNPSVDVIYGNALIVNEEGDLISARRELPLERSFINNVFLNVFSCATFFRRCLWDNGILKLDESFRYAADLDLMNRLMNQKVKMMHVDHFFSLFTSDGNNLSTHPKMKFETREIRDKYSRSTLNLYPFLRTRRYIRRYIAGHYKKQHVNYQYAINEVPIYKAMNGYSGGSFRF